VITLFSRELVGQSLFCLKEEKRKKKTVDVVYCFLLNQHGKYSHMSPLENGVPELPEPD